MKHFYKQFFLFSCVVVSSSLAMQENREKPNTPRYDRARGHFTEQPLSLVHYASKQVDAHFASSFHEIHGENVDEFSTKVNATLAKLPLELRPLVEQQTVIEAAKNGYTFEYRKKVDENYEREIDSGDYSINGKGKILEIINKNTGNKKEVLFEYNILTICKSPQEQLIAVTEHNQITFLGNNGEVWDVISKIPIETSFKCFGFLDDTTAILFDSKDTLNICTHKDRKLSISQQKLDPAPKGLLGFCNVLFFYDTTGTLFACQSAVDGNFLKKIRENGSKRPFGPHLVSSNKNNYVVFQGDQGDLNVISKINGIVSFVKSIQYNNRRYLRSFENGILTIKKIDDTPGHFSTKKFESTSIDVDTEKTVNTFKDTFYFEPLLNLSFSAILASIALSNSAKNKDSLVALKESSLVESLPEEYKSHILSKIEEIGIL